MPLTVYPHTQQGYATTSREALVTEYTSSYVDPSLSTAGRTRYADPDVGWTEKHNTSSSTRTSRKKTWIIVFVLITLVAIVGVVVGVVVSKLVHRNDEKKNHGMASSSSSSLEPWNFQKDKRFHQSFYGMCYTPFNSQYQFGCGANLSSVIQDIQTLSQLTTRIRLYGADCNVTALVLQAIQETRVNLTVFPAIYLDQQDPNDIVWNRQIQNITFALDNYGTSHIGGLTVGNEYLLDGGSTTSLLNYVSKAKTLVETKGWNLQVGTADAGSEISKTVVKGVDYFMANVHAWFAGTLIKDAADWTWDYFETTDVSVAEKVVNKPKVYIAETGWPPGANDTQSLTYINDQGQKTGAEAGVSQLQTFLDTYVCEANKNGTKYFYFELYDEEWKDALYGGVEAHWGLFDKDKNLKQITLPNCSHD